MATPLVAAYYTCPTVTLSIRGGDALVTLDPYTGRTSSRIIAGAATADSSMALASLNEIAETAGEVESIRIATKSPPPR